MADDTINVFDERKVEITIQGAGSWRITEREAAGLISALNAMTKFDLNNLGMVVLTVYAHESRSPIPPIKAIRQLLGLNLKDAKDAVDMLANKPIKIGPIHESRLPFIEQVLKEGGLLYRGASLVERIGKLDDNDGHDGHAPVGAKV